MVDKYIRAVIPLKSAPPRDPLGRKPGEWLYTDPEGAAMLARKKRVVGPREWSSLFQQTPLLAEGGLISRSHFLDPNRKRLLPMQDFYERAQGVLWSRFWDLAYTAKTFNKADPDFTVGAKMGFKIDKWGQSFEIYLAHIYRYRDNWTQVKHRIAEIALTDTKECVIGAEANGAQKGAVDQLYNYPPLADFQVMGYPVGTDKVANAHPWMDRAREGMMWVCEGDWNGAFFDEIETFPNGNHDDIVDAVSGAYYMSAQRLTEYRRADPGQKTAIQFHKRW